MITKQLLRSWSACWNDDKIAAFAGLRRWMTNDRCSIHRTVKRFMNNLAIGAALCRA